MSYLKEFAVRGKTMEFPIFFPDATRGVIRSLDSDDITNSQTPGVIVNTYHLMSEPGTTVVEAAGGIKKFMGFDGFVISDSGGFQVLSLIYKDPSFGKINDRGVTFLKGSKGKKENYPFTPEKSIQVQFALDSDIMICLDDCPPQKASREKVEVSVNRTIEWAKRCKEEFERQVAIRNKESNKKVIARDKLSGGTVYPTKPASPKREQGGQSSGLVGKRANADIGRSPDDRRPDSHPLRDDNSNRPLLFAVIQGNDHKDLREKCAKALIEISFDGYGFGGWPMDQENNFNAEILKYTVSLMPDHLPKYALGVGMPEDIVKCVQMGYTIFDTVLPTRDARHQRLYVFTKNPNNIGFAEKSDVFGYVQIKQGKYENDPKPISKHCDCFACQNYTRAYLHHLFHIEDSSAHRLATIHNLRMYSKLTELLRLKR